MKISKNKKVLRIMILGLGIAAASFFAFLNVLFRRNFQQKRYSGKPDLHSFFSIAFPSGCNGEKGMRGKPLIIYSEFISIWIKLILGRF